jgi:hypothetical protein
MAIPDLSGRAMHTHPMDPELAAFLDAALRDTNFEGVRLEAAPAPYWRWDVQLRMAQLREMTPDGPPFPVDS